MAQVCGAPAAGLATGSVRLVAGATGETCSQGRVPALVSSLWDGEGPTTSLQE